MTREEKHNNFIKVIKFLYPKDPIKKWVCDDLDSGHNYGNSWDNIMGLLETITKHPKIKDFEIGIDYAAIVYCENNEDGFHKNALCEDKSLNIKQKVYIVCLEAIDYLQK
jgi:hypothetical protein